MSPQISLYRSQLCVMTDPVPATFSLLTRNANVPLADGAKVPFASQSLSRAKWEVVYRGEHLVRRGQSVERLRDDRPDEPEFSLAPDLAYEAWTVKRGAESIKMVKDAGGIRLIGLLVANPGRSIHALDLHAALAKRPPSLGPLCSPTGSSR